MPEYLTHTGLECALMMAGWSVILWPRYLTTTMSQLFLIFFIAREKKKNIKYIVRLLEYTFDKRILIILNMQALRKEPLTVYGDGKQTRSFQFVSDLVCDFLYQYPTNIYF